LGKKEVRRKIVRLILVEPQSMGTIPPQGTTAKRGGKGLGRSRIEFYQGGSRRGYSTEGMRESSMKKKDYEEHLAGKNDVRKVTQQKNLGNLKWGTIKRGNLRAQKAWREEDRILSSKWPSEEAQKKSNLKENY